MAGAARGTGIVGSLVLELERSFRIMLLKVAKELTVADCQDIAFVAKLPAPTCVPEPGKPAVNLHTMNTLESLGLIGPLRVDFLEEMLKTSAIGKNYLLEIIDDYKKYREARLDDQKKKATTNPMDPSLSGCSPEAQELLAFKADAAKKCRLKESYATLLTQFSQMTLLLRSVIIIENDDLTPMEDTFVSVASDGDAITRTLRKNLSAAGIKCGSDSSSSSINSAVTSPTDSEVQPLAAAHSPSNSPPRAVRMETQIHFHHASQEGSPSPSAQRKKPIPLPRKKWPAQPESSGTGGVPVSSPTLSPRVTTKFVYCQQESQLPPAAGLNTALLHIPQSASTSCLTCSSDYSGDYSGDYTGTGDSGVGDIRSKYTPSQEALDQLEPRQQQQPSVEHGQAEAEGDGNQRSRYMKLVQLEEKSSADGYTKARRARSLEVEKEDENQPCYVVGEESTAGTTRSSMPGLGNTSYAQEKDYRRHPPNKPHDKIVVMARLPDRRPSADAYTHCTAHPNLFVGQFSDLLPPVCGDTTAPIQVGTAAKLPRATSHAVQKGLSLADLLASTPGLRPWSRDMGGNRSSWHFSKSCLSRKFIPCVVTHGCDKLQGVIRAI